MRPFPLPVTQPVEEMAHLYILFILINTTAFLLPLSGLSAWHGPCSVHVTSVIPSLHLWQQKQNPKRHIMNFNQMNTPKTPVGQKLSVKGINITVIHTLKVDDHVSSVGELVAEVAVSQAVLCGFVLILHHLGVVGQLHKLPEDVGFHTHTPFYGSVFKYLKGDSLTAAVIDPRHPSSSGPWDCSPDSSYQQDCRRDIKDLGRDLLLIQPLVELCHVVLGGHLSLHITEMMEESFFLFIFLPNIPEQKEKSLEWCLP